MTLLHQVNDPNWMNMAFDFATWFFYNIHFTTGIERLLDHRNSEVWMLFGTLPFYPCSSSQADLELQKRLFKEKNVSVRNDPDGRSR